MNGGRRQVISKDQAREGCFASALAVRHGLSGAAALTEHLAPEVAGSRWDVGPVREQGPGKVAVT